MLPERRFNVCTGRETTLLDLLEELSEVSSHQPKVRFGAPRPGDILPLGRQSPKSIRGAGLPGRNILTESEDKPLNG